jgi:hypothetical protein
VTGRAIAHHGAVSAVVSASEAKSGFIEGILIGRGGGSVQVGLRRCAGSEQPVLRLRGRACWGRVACAAAAAAIVFVFVFVAVALRRLTLAAVVIIVVIAGEQHRQRPRAILE